MNFNPLPAIHRAAFHRAIRNHLDSQGFLEVETPSMSSAPIPESSIELFATERIVPDGRLSRLYLLPSPELNLKLALASGAPSLYQISRCFRNGEQLERWHRLEFTMLEWYALRTSAEENIHLMDELISCCLDALKRLPGPDAVHPPPGMTLPSRKMSMDQAFTEFAGFSLEKDLLDAGLGDCGPADEDYGAALTRACRTLGIRLAELGLSAAGEGNGAGPHEADDMFHRLFVSHVEDRLPDDRPLLLYDWPALVPTLARRRSGTPWSERWEMYIGGVEVANCFGEENDAAALEAYWASESARKRQAAIAMQADPDWLHVIAARLPDCSGVAVGLDRLLALIRGDKDLRGVDFFGLNV